MLKSPLFNEAGAGDGGGGSGGSMGGLESLAQAQADYGNKGAFAETRQQAAASTESTRSTESQAATATDTAQTQQAAAKPARRGMRSAVENPPAAETATTEASTDVVEVPKDQKAWTEAHAAKKWKQEWEPKLTEYQKKAEEYEQRQKDWEAKQSRLEELENRVAAFDVQSTPEFQNEVSIPEQKQLQIIDDIIHFTEVSAQDIFAALQETNRFHRAKKLREVLSNSKEDVPAAAETDILNAWDRLGELDGRKKELLGKASQLKEQFKTKDEAVRIEQEKERNAKFSSAVTEVNTQLKTGLKDFLTEDLTNDFGEKFSMDEFDNVKPSTDINDLVYNEQAGYLLPFFKTENRKLKKELADLRAERKERAAVGNPTGRAGQSSAATDRPGGMSLEQAQQAQLQHTSVRR